ncbi:MAG: hydrogenase maturation protease [Candidatus Thermoplasmatota archaeon]|nr:hydrogenase maturation protease [Candidatus Thermoplasmatota archaeon]
MMRKIGIIGIGNPLRSDDGIGVLLLDKLIERKKEFSQYITFIDGGTGGLGLLPLLSRFTTLVFVDAVDFGGKVAESKLLRFEDMKSMKTCITSTTHESDMLHVLLFSKQLNMSADEIFFYGIQPKDTSSGTTLSYELQKKFDFILHDLIRCIKNVERG